MATWSFSTDSLPPAERNAAWQREMQRLRLPYREALGEEAIRGDIHAVDTPMGMEFAVVEAGPYVISGQPEEPGDGFWISLICEGRGHITSEGVDTDVGPEMLMCGLAGRPSTLRLESDHRQLFVRIPARAIASRLIAAPRQPLLVIDCSTGANAVLASMLIALAAQVGDTSSDEFGAIEVAIVEFLVQAIARAGNRAMRGGSTGLRAGLFDRVLQSLEAELEDPELSLSTLANITGLTNRTLSRLFQENGSSFGTYIKERRLHRCAQDLASPLYSQLSISEIGFRWGFNSSAHFSRSFRDRFGVSPREYRRQG